MSSRVRLVVVMDPIDAIKPAKDSTLAIVVDNGQIAQVQDGSEHLEDRIAFLSGDVEDVERLDRVLELLGIADALHPVASALVEEVIIRRFGEVQLLCWWKLIKTTYKNI